MTERQQLYWALLQQGHNVSTVARACGVSRQAVQQATVGWEAQRKRRRRYYDKNRQSVVVLKYKCSLCGSRLHTKARHRK